MAEQFEQTCVSLVYDGGLAASGQLHLYEYSRAVYGYSRLIQTIEYYRRQGAVVERIGKRANTDIIISAPRQGSFIFDAVVMTSAHVIPALRDVPFKALLAFVLDLLKVGKKQDREETIVKLAEIGLAESRERTAQTREESQRVKSLQKIVETQSATTSKALDIVAWAMKSSNRAIGRAELTNAHLLLLKQDIEADAERGKQLASFDQQLGRLNPDDLANLTSRARPLIQEVGLPLRKSADTVQFSLDPNSRPIAKFDSDEIKHLQSKSIDTNQSTLSGSLKSYDRESGFGKLREQPQGKVTSFFVPSYSRPVLRPQVSAAMQRAVSTFVGRAVRNKSGIMTSFLVDRIE